MRRIFIGFSLFVMMAGLSAADVPLGYGGPGGTRVYPDAKPPTKFDLTGGKGAQWTAALPSWGHGSPVATAGKVFVIVEPRPEQIFPCLIALDAKNGKQLWERPLDHLKAARAEDSRKDLEAWFAKQAELLAAQFGQKKPSPDKAHAAKARELNKACGFQYDNWRMISGKTRWCLTLSCMGEAFGTPVCDGERVYACTPSGGYFAFDLSGRPVWTTYAPRPGFHNANGTQRGRSLLLHDGLLISDVLDHLRAFDARSGKLLWEHGAGDNVESMMTPAVITVDGKDILLTAAPGAFLLPKGKRIEVSGWTDPGMQCLVKHDERDVAFFCGSGEHCGWTGKGKAPIQPPAAFRFSLKGGTLTAKLLWDGGNLGGKKAWGGNAPWMLYHAGRFYHRGGAVLDALTGKIMAGEISRKSRAVPRTNHLLAWADGKVFGLTKGGRKGAEFVVCSEDGKPVARNPVPPPPLTAEQKRVLAWACGSDAVTEGRDWPAFSYGSTFTFDGGRLYLRSMMHVTCVGR